MVQMVSKYHGIDPFLSTLVHRLFLYSSIHRASESVHYTGRKPEPPTTGYTFAPQIYTITSKLHGYPTSCGGLPRGHATYA